MELAALVVQSASILILLVTVVVLTRQAAEAKRAAYAQGFEVVYELLQNEETLAARRHILNTLEGRAYETWSDEDKLQAETVCRSYDAAAIMCRNGMLPDHVLADSWGRSVMTSWERTRPLVLEHRSKRGDNFWDDFSWLAVRSAEVQEDGSTWLQENPEG